MKYCSQCGTELKDDAKFCANCGAKCQENNKQIHTTKDQAKSKMKSRQQLMIGITAILSVVALGVFSMCLSNSLKKQQVLEINSDIVLSEENYVEATEVTVPSINMESAVKSLGAYTLDEVKSGGYGFYIMYEDGSFDRYYSGNVLTWEGPRPMTYGSDYIPEDMIISISKDRSNREKIQHGKLVLVCSETNRVEYSLTPVEFSGNALSTTAEGKTIAIFLSKSSLYYWSSGSNIGGYGASIIKVNNTPLSDWGANLESENSRGYFPLQAGQEMEISIAYGATMETFDCVVDHCYYFQDRDAEMDLKFDPTTEGYAIIDFTDVPAGEYLIHYSYWNESSRARSVLATHVVVE